MAVVRLDKVELQKRIDSTYPPNHCYDIDTLECAAGTMERAEQIKSYINDLIKDKVVLDIGCNKGYFSLWCALNGAKQVIAQDINPEYTVLLRDVINHKSMSGDAKDVNALKIRNLNHEITLVNEPISTYFREGDIALILGAAHYLTYEQGLDWIYRLYIMGYDLFIELPISKEDPVVQVHEKAGTANENSKLLSMEAFMEKTKGLYDVKDLGRCAGLGRRLLYCKKQAIWTDSLELIDLAKWEVISNTAMAVVLKKGDQVLKLNFKNPHYPDRWIRIHKILEKEFPDIIPKLYSVVKESGLNRGKITAYCGYGKPDYGNLFKIQNYLISLNMMMCDFHPNHAHGSHVVDLESIGNIEISSWGYLHRFVNDTWIVGGVYDDPNINQQLIQKFVDNISNRALFKASSNYANVVQKDMVIKDIKEIFKETESWSDITKQT